MPQGVDCKNCGTFIPLQQVWDTAPQRTVWREGKSIPDFTHTCEKCGKRYTYTQEDVISA